MLAVEPYAVRAEKRRVLLDSALADIVALCASKSDIRGVYVFGSYASGNVGPHSDLDLVVVRETTLPRVQRGDDLLRERRMLVPLDLIVLRPDEFDDRLKNSSFGRTILQNLRRVDAG